MICLQRKIEYKNVNNDKCIKPVGNIFSLSASKRHSKRVSTDSSTVRQLYWLLNIINNQPQSGCDITTRMAKGAINTTL